MPTPVEVQLAGVGFTGPRLTYGMRGMIALTMEVQLAGVGFTPCLTYGMRVMNALSVEVQLAGVGLTGP